MWRQAFEKVLCDIPIIGHFRGFILMSHTAEDDKKKGKEIVLKATVGILGISIPILIAKDLFALFKLKKDTKKAKLKELEANNKLLEQKCTQLEDDKKTKEDAEKKQKEDKEEDERKQKADVERKQKEEDERKIKIKEEKRIRKEEDLNKAKAFALQKQEKEQRSLRNKFVFQNHTSVPVKVRVTSSETKEIKEIGGGGGASPVGATFKAKVVFEKKNPQSQKRLAQGWACIPFTIDKGKHLVEVFLDKKSLGALFFKRGETWDFTVDELPPAYQTNASSF